MIDDAHVSFAAADELTVRRQQVGDVTIYRLNHPQVRMEINVMVGDVLVLARMASETTVSFHRPQPGPLTDEDKRLLGGLFLGAVEADTRLEAGDITILADDSGETPQGLRYVERTMQPTAMSVVKHVAMVFGPGSTGAVVGYQSGRKAMETVEAWKDTVLTSIRFK